SAPLPGRGRRPDGRDPEISRTCAAPSRAAYTCTGGTRPDRNDSMRSHRAHGPVDALVRQGRDDLTARRTPRGRDTPVRTPIHGDPSPLPYLIRYLIRHGSLTRPPAPGRLVT